MGHLGAEQQPADARIAGDSPDDVGDTGPVLFGAGRRGHRRLGGGGQFGGHGVEDRFDEDVLVGEALVKISCGKSGFGADRAHRQIVGVALAEQLEPGFEEALPAQRPALNGGHAAVGTTLRHPLILTPVNRDGNI